MAWTVLEVLAEHAEQDGAGDAIVDLSIRSIADQLGIDERAVERAVRRLIHDGHVVIPTPIDLSPKQRTTGQAGLTSHEQLNLLSND